MAHFAKIIDGTVAEILVVDNKHEANGEAYLHSLGLDGKWVQTSFNANFGKKFAAIGDTYVASTGNFKPAQPFASWKWNANDWIWTPPKAKPDADNVYIWDEETLDWVLIPNA